MDNGEEKNGGCTSRLRHMAVRMLGYTHTEFGMRPMHRIVEELDTVLGVKMKAASGDDGAWIDEEVI